MSIVSTYAKASPEGFKAFVGVHVAIQKSSLPKQVGRSRLSSGIADQWLRNIASICIAAICLSPALPWTSSFWCRCGPTQAGVFSHRERAALAWAETRNTRGRNRRSGCRL